MKRLLPTLLSLCLLLFGMQAWAQNEDAAMRLALDHLQTNYSDYGITAPDVSDIWVSSAYASKKSGITHVYFSQQYQGIEVLQAVGNANIDRDGALINMNVAFVRGLTGKITHTTPGIPAVQAVVAVADRLEIALPAMLPIAKSEGGPMRKVQYEAGDYALEPIKVRLAYHQAGDAGVRLVWEVQYYEKGAAHLWNTLVDASTGKILYMHDHVLHCDFGGSAENTSHSGHVHKAAPESLVFNDGAGYNVFPMPVESPNHGDREIVFDPADPTASPYGWHDFDGLDGADTTITFGNNVHAYLDTADVDWPLGDEPDGGPDLLFDFPLDVNAAPSTYREAAVVNLFYWNNIMHDVTYQYGFDEAAGNFQLNNYGNGGEEGDYVNAHAQDGGGTNNANFSTPTDGDNPRMQMYLWYGGGDPEELMTIDTPSILAGTYLAVEAGFGPGLPTDVPITAELVLVDDGSLEPTFGCDPLINGSEISGKIALIDRGSCNFTTKVQNAQFANAIAVIVCNNNENPPYSMPGNGGGITIPSIMISMADCDTIKTELANGVTVSLLGTGNPTPIYDGDFDSGIVCHEYGHGISNRLTGGPGSGGCLSGGEQMGEGWSDYYSIMLTMKEGDMGEDIHGIGTFAIGEPTDGVGIRPAPYSTDWAINPYTYTATNDVDNISQPHGVGFVWCTMLWDMTWALIDEYGYDPDIYNGTGGNNISMQLVMEGMKLQPCNPGFVDGRDAILLADQQLYDGANQCLIWEAFANRGLGKDAEQGSSASRTDQVEAFNMPNICLDPDFPPVADFEITFAVECSGLFTFEDQSTLIPQYYLWDFGDGNTSTEEDPTHVYDSEGTYVVTLTVSNTLGEDVTSQTVFVDFIDFPLVEDVTACDGTNVTLTAEENGYDINWYENGELVFTGQEFAPTLAGSTTYMVESEEKKLLQQVGPPDNSFGGGGYHSTGFTGTTIFEAYVPFILDSVWVDAGDAGDRLIQLFDESGTPIDEVTVFMPQGPSTVAIGLEIPSPGIYQVGGTSINLYRNNEGAQYPYELPGILTMTESSAFTDPLGYYYYLYDWKVRELSCFSEQVPLEVVALAAPTAQYSFLQGGAHITFVDESTDATSWLWVFGDGSTSTEQSPNHFFVFDGDYEVTLTVSNGECESTFTQIITIINSGAYAIEGLTEFELYPTLGGGQFTLIVSMEKAADLEVKVVNVLGQEVYQLLQPQTTFFEKEIQLPELAAGTYFVQLRVEGQRAVKRYVLISD